MDHSTLGIAKVVRLAYEGGDLAGLDRALIDRIGADPTDAAALLDYSVLLFATGRAEDGRRIQRMAIDLQRCFHRAQGAGTRLLVFMAPGDFMANTPIDFLVERSDLDVWIYFVDDQTTGLTGVPEHDAAFLAVGQSAENQPILERMAPLLAHWPVPVLNRDAAAIADLSRDGVSGRLASDPYVYAPATLEIERSRLVQIAAAAASLAIHAPGTQFPLILRPVDSHAGRELEKLDDAQALSDYLDRTAGERFYISSFVNYAGPDGLFRKQRIAFIDGKAFPCHLAASEHWIVHYLSARMAEEPTRRAEEAAWMADFDNDFATRHAKAFEALNRLVGLDYFGIDCAEMPDGRLLLFEADVAMLVHDLDPVDVFPYKKPAMHRLFDAFTAAVEARARR